MLLLITLIYSEVFIPLIRLVGALIGGGGVAIVAWTIQVSHIFWDYLCHWLKHGAPDVNAGGNEASYFYKRVCCIL